MNPLKLYGKKCEHLYATVFLRILVDRFQRTLNVFQRSAITTEICNTGCTLRKTSQDYVR